MEDLSTECKIDVLEESIVLSNDLIKLTYHTKLGYISLADDDTNIFTQGYAQVHTEDTVFDSRQMTYKAFSFLDFNENGKNGKAIVIRLLDPNSNSAVNLRFSMLMGVSGYSCRIQFNNRTDKDVRVKSIDPLVIDVDNDSRLEIGWNSRDLRFFKNGFHSWELSQAQFIQPGENKSHCYSVLTNASTGKSLVVGFVTMENQLNIISVYGRDNENSRLERIVASSLTDDIPVPDAETIVSEEMIVLSGEKGRELLAQYIEITAKKMDAITCEKVPVGWCSWYFYFTQPDEGEIISNAEFLEQRFGKEIEWIQIDDGYQKKVGDWEVNERFSPGFKALVTGINELGYRVGLWVAPFVASVHSDIFKEKPDWFIRDENGTPIVVDENPLWLGEYCAFDLTNPDVISHIEGIFRQLKEDGFEYWKIDFLYHATHPGIRYDMTIPRGQAFRMGLEAIRRAVGDDIILGCGAPLGPCIGYTDAMRIGTDIATDWRYDWGAGVYECTINTITRAVMHNIWWSNDPDCVLVRQEDNNLSHDEIILWLSIVALSGGLFLLSDKMDEVSEDRLDLIDKVLPPYQKGAIALDALIEPEPRLFILPIETPLGKWAVAAIINLTEKPVGVSFNLNDAGLDEHVPHHIWDFWNQEYEGITEQQVDITGLKPHTCKLLAIRPESEIPTILSTTMHFTQGAVELSNFEWNEAKKELVVTITKTTRKPEAIFFEIGANWIPETAFLDDEQMKLEMVAPEVIAVRHQYKRGQILRMKFSK